jgi:glycosyltransferase involved in cell wall biosynthesis
MQSSIPDQLEGHWLLGTRPLQILLRRMEKDFIQGASVVACSAGLDSQVRTISANTAVETWQYPPAAPAVHTESAQQLRRKLAIPESAPVIYYGGNFAGYQRVENLLAALPRVRAAVPEAVFLLVGAAEQGRDAVRLPAGVPAEACRIVPRVPRSAVVEYLALANVAVSARTGGNNLPLKIIDYMAAGKAIVATDHPAHRSVLDDSVSLLVGHTPDKLADGIVSLLLEPARAARLGTAAQARADRMFGLSAFDRQVTRVLRHVLPAEAAAVRFSPGRVL